MQAPSTNWRVSPVAWLPITLAVAAESISNALRAYGLGMHLDRFTVQIHGQPVSIAGAVLVLAAVAVSLSQARAAWVALTPGRPARQRIVSGLAAGLLLTISITAMASHILEAQRAQVADEGGARGRYDRVKAAHDKAVAELQSLGQPRPVSVIQAEVSAAKIDMAIWRRSAQCSDISRDDSKTACAPILTLYKERGQSARKMELEPEVARLRSELAQLHRPEEQSKSEEAVAGGWAWIMGLGVVFIATFGTVIFATVDPAAKRDTPPPPREPGIAVAPTVVVPPPSLPVPSTGPGGSKSERDALADLRLLLQAGQEIPSQDWLSERWGVRKSTTSKWLAKWEAEGHSFRRPHAGKARTVTMA